MSPDSPADLTQLSVVALTPSMDAMALDASSRKAWDSARCLLDLPGLDSAVPLRTPFPALEPSDGGTTPAALYVGVRPTDLPAAAPADAANAARAWRHAYDALSPERRTWSSVLALAQKHAARLAIDAGRSDVPLVSARRLASALAVCLVHGAERLGVLVADFSGIQPYLFEVAEVGAGGVARSLRARSFFIAQLSALLSRAVQRRLNLGPHNTILDAGGKFHMLFPWTDSALAELDRIRAEVAEWCIAQLHGELAVNMALTPLEPADLQAGRFGDVLTRADRELRVRKAQRLGDALLDGAKWRADAFVSAADWGGMGPCRACGRFPADPSGTKCAWCMADESRGRRLTQAEWVGYRPGGGSDPLDVRAFGWAAHIGQGPPPEDTEAWLFEPANAGASTATPFRFVARHVPIGETGERLTFEEMAASAPGRPYLGYLKADVDRLGERMALGLCRDAPPHYDDPARISHLSDALEAFFAGRLEQTIRDRYPMCYVVFSGGDDLTVVGPHHDILRLAIEVAEDFRTYIGYPAGPPTSSDVLTMSAGIAVATARRPLAVAVDLAERELHRAKREGRCRLGMFGQSLTWTNARAAFRTLWQKTGEPTCLGAELLDTSRTSSAFLYHLLAYARMWGRFRSGDTSQIRYQPMLAYEIGRNVDKTRLPAVHAWASRLAQMTAGPPGVPWQEEMDRLGVVVRLAILNRSSGREE